MAERSGGKAILVFVSIVLAIVIVVLTRTGTTGQSEKWYPSKWGENDQRGAANRMTPEKVLDAKSVITRGVVYSLGRTYEPGMPMFGTRHFSIRIPQAFKIAGKNDAVYHDEIVSGELGQIGTQFDGLGHLGVGDLFYNGNNRRDFAQAEGLTKLGIENVGPLVTRGVLIDVARYKGVAQLEATYEITAADLKGAMEQQKIQIHPGDVVLIHTGWGSLWMKDNAKYGASSPGIGLGAAQLLAAAEIVVVGADNWGVEVFPNPDSSLGAPVHQLMLAKNGIYLHENLNLADMARDGVTEFAYIFSPLPLKGATGSPGSPLAIR